MRHRLRSLPPDRIKDLVAALARSLAPNARLADYKISDFRDKDRPVTITANVEIPGWASKTGNLLLFKARAEQGAGAAQSPFQTDRRTHPVFQEKAALGEATIEVTLPAGFSVLSAPESLDISSELGRFQRRVVQSDGRMAIVVRAENRQADIPPSRYPEVRKYYSEFLNAANEQIVLKKG
jgi:hypothetical protein